jgi:sortase (surface protein transpeptidase)
LLTVLIVAALLVGGGLALAGFTARGGGDDVVLDVDGAVAVTAPSTVPPRSTALTDGDDNRRFAAASDPAGLSPLAERLGERFSAIPEVRAPRPRPVRIEIDTIDVARFPIRAIGLEPDGQMEIPDETEIGWYQYGATAGRPGATVLAAHVSWNRTAGPFARLGTVDPGARIAVTLDDGSVRTYEVVERAIYGKLELPRERLWRNTGPEELVLITCGGDYNPEIRRYRENIVVYAVPVA